MAGTNEYRAPRWWAVAGATSVVAAPVLWAAGELAPAMAVVGIALGAAMVFAWIRTFVVIDDAGITWSPNGFRTFHADWNEIVAVQRRRMLFGTQRVAIPPLAGDPLGRIELELKYRNTG